MRYGMCNLSVVAVRLEPSHQSEMTTQLLFGELMEIVERTEDWAKVRIIHDDYMGWISDKQYMPLYHDDFEKLNNFGSCITLDLVQVLTNESSHTVMPVLLGSTLPFVANNSFYLNDQKYIFEGHLRTGKDASNAENIVENAYMYMDAPYMWGGRSPFGIDCSGLVQMAYKLSGINLPRDASQQAQQGTPINFMAEAKAGDLAFFDNEEGAIIHVGIVLSGNSIIHASGRVRVDTLDHEGIYHGSLRKYTHKLRIIKRITG